MLLWQRHQGLYTVVISLVENADALHRSRASVTVISLCVTLALFLSYLSASERSYDQPNDLLKILFGAARAFVTLSIQENGPQLEDHAMSHLGGKAWIIYSNGSSSFYRTIATWMSMITVQQYLCDRYSRTKRGCACGRRVTSMLVLCQMMPRSGLAVVASYYPQV